MIGITRAPKIIDARVIKSFGSIGNNTTRRCYFFIKRKGIEEGLNTRAGLALGLGYSIKRRGLIIIATHHREHPPRLDIKSNQATVYKRLLFQRGPHGVSALGIMKFY